VACSPDQGLLFWRGRNEEEPKPRAARAEAEARRVASAQGVFPSSRCPREAVRKRGMIEEVSRTVEKMGGRSQTTRTERTSEAGDLTHQGNLQIRFDSGREARFNIREHPRRDYAVTAAAVRGPRGLGGRPLQ